MKPWIDPRERRARWYWLTGLVLSVLALVGMVSLMLWVELTSEERMIAIATAVLALVCTGGSIWQLKQYPKDLQQYEEPL
jgi:uncharacterized membrane protein YqjE